MPMPTPPIAQWLPFALPGVPRASRRTRLPRPPRVVTADFAGNACPVGSRVRFTVRRQVVAGVVAELQHARAVVVAAADGTRWKVPYASLTVVEPVPERECTLAEVEALAHELLARHVAESGLDADWSFGFDLATSRGGVCRPAEKRIGLAVSYCHRATRADIVDTLLHEIAHAIVGVHHQHDAVWRAKAREIGSTAERCHDVRHTPARWVGACGCGQRWQRQRLSRHLRRGARCARCDREITWRRNTDLAPFAPA